MRPRALFTLLVAGLALLPPAAHSQVVVATTSIAPAATPPAAIPPALPWRRGDGGALPFAEEATLLEFLRTAPVVERRELPDGTTHPAKLTLERDGLRLHAIFRSFEGRAPRAENVWSPSRTRDSYRAEVAAWELDRLLGIGRVPPTVLRELAGERGSLQLWIEGAETYADRLRRERGNGSESRATFAGGAAWMRQRAAMRTFDLLIHNVDRHEANSLVTPGVDGEPQLWFVDHTRAFQTTRRLLPEAREPGLVDRELYRRLRQLDEATLSSRLAPYLDRPALHALLERRRTLLELVERRIALHGEGAVLLATGLRQADELSDELGGELTVQVSESP